LLDVNVSVQESLIPVVILPYIVSILLF